MMDQLSREWSDWGNRKGARIVLIKDGFKINVIYQKFSCISSGLDF